MFCSRNGGNEDGVVCSVKELSQTIIRDDSRRNGIFGHKEKCEQDEICEMGGSSYNSSRKTVS
jgi:hypothetical protein